MGNAKDPRVRLGHILENIDGILESTAGLDMSYILSKYMLIRSTERGLQIISEAAKELPQDIRDLEPDVPWSKIIGIGNFLRHEYYRINETDIQSIVKTHLPELRPAVAHLLARLEG
jgi:uncharacterized protein with HEPN domain